MELEKKSQHLFKFPKPDEYMPAALAPLLSYEDLIRPNEYVAIVEPSEIPVHLDVFLSPLVYSEEFVTEVARSVPDSIRQDVAAIKRTLGIFLDMEVTEEGVIHRNQKTRFGDFTTGVKSGKTGFVEVTYKGTRDTSDTGIALVKEGYCQRVFSPDNDHPMPKGKFKAYGITSGDFDTKLPTWYIHNLRFAGLGGLLYFRNFAIMFNNLGLKKLGNRS